MTTHLPLLPRLDPRATLTELQALGARWIGPTGTTIVVRLSAFLLFCIGIQVMWNGAAELLGRLPFGTTGTG